MPASDLPDLRPRALARWLKALPVADPDAVARALIDALREINGTSLEPSPRLRFLETLRPTARLTLESLRRHNYGREFPPSPASRAAIQLQLTLVQEMTSGYELAARDGTQFGARFRKKQLALALQRTLRGLSLMLLEHYQLRMAPPAGVWQRLHAAYRAAVAHSVQDLSIENDELSRGSRATLADAYKQLLLFAIVDPFSAPQQTLSETFAECARWTSAVILQLPADAPASAQWQVEPDRDSPPQPRKADTATGDVLVLDASEALRQRQSGQESRRGWRLGWKKEPSAPVPDNGSPLQRLHATPPSRRAPREEKDGRALVVVGLTRISQMLGAELGLEVETAAKTAVTVEAQKGEWAFDATRKQWNFIRSEPREHPRATDAGRQERSEQRSRYAETGAIVDMSVSGYRLRLEGQAARRVSVGEALLLLDEEATDTPLVWRLGLVRWLRRASDVAIEAGIALIGRDPHPVLIRPIGIDAQPGRDRVWGLVARGLTEEAPSERLLASRLQYSLPDGVVVHDSVEGAEIRLARALESTSSLTLFACETDTRTGRS